MINNTSHFEKLFPKSIQLYSYLREFAFEHSNLTLVIAKRITFTLQNPQILTVATQDDEGLFFNVQLEPKLIEPYLKTLKFYGFITSYMQIKNNTFEVVLRKTPESKAA